MDTLINPKLIVKPTFGSYTREVQSGKGLFTLFSKVVPTLASLFKRAIPIAKKAASHPFVRSAARELKQHAADIGLNLAESAVNGENMGEALKRETKNAGRSIAQRIISSERKRRKRIVEDDISRSREKKKNSGRLVEVGSKAPVIAHSRARTAKLSRRRKKVDLFSGKNG